MHSKNAILWPVLISFISHMLLITITGVIDLRQNIRPLEILAVNIEEPEWKPPQKEEKSEEKKPSEDKEGKKVAVNDGWREETIDLSSLDIKYAAYLNMIKKKILRIWEYPKKAYENNEEGNVTVKVSIDADGSLAKTILLSSSGSIELDHGALSVIKAAAPFDPLPGYYNLSRLNIVASFRYRIRD
jgi:TonB family protein